MTDRKISPVHVLLVLVIFFAGGTVYLALTMPEGCSDTCLPVYEVHYLDTFYILSPENVPGNHYLPEPEIEYDGKNWAITGETLNNTDRGYRVTGEDHIFPPGAVIPYYNPDMKISDDKIYFNAIVYNNIGYELPDVTFNVSFDVNIRKNTNGGYGAYSRYEPEKWQEPVSTGNLPVNSSKEIRIYAPLFAVKDPESISVEVFLVLPENLTAADGTLLEFDRNEYIPSVSIPDIYDAGDSGGRDNKKMKIFEYYINPRQ